MSDYQSLLPPNATELEQQMEQISAELILSVDFDCRTLWSPEECAASLLPYLASAVGLDQWSDSLDEYLKRDTIARAIDIQSKKGTLYSIKSAAGSFGVTTVVQEYRDSPQTMAPCNYIITAIGVNPEIQQSIESAVYRVVRASDSFTLVNGVSASTSLNMMPLGFCTTFQRFECPANADSDYEGGDGGGTVDPPPPGDENWTPDFDGSGAYYLPAAWLPSGNFRVTGRFIRDPGHSGTMTILGSLDTAGAADFDIRVTENGELIFEKDDVTELTLSGIVDGQAYSFLLEKSGNQITLEYTDLSSASSLSTSYFSFNTINEGFAAIGGTLLSTITRDFRNNWIGQITEISFDDLSTENNSRYYPLIVESATAPSAESDAVDMLGGYNGLAYGFTREWMILNDSSESQPEPEPEGDQTWTPNFNNDGAYYLSTAWYASGDFRISGLFKKRSGSSGIATIVGSLAPSGTGKFDLFVTETGQLVFESGDNLNLTLSGVVSDQSYSFQLENISSRLTLQYMNTSTGDSQSTYLDNPSFKSRFVYAIGGTLVSEETHEFRNQFSGQITGLNLQDLSSGNNRYYPLEMLSSQPPPAQSDAVDSNGGYNGEAYGFTNDWMLSTL